MVVGFVIAKQSWLSGHEAADQPATLRARAAQQMGPTAWPRDVYVVGYARSHS